jgi:outer membrane protein TolC
VLRETSSGQDVTSEYVDLRSRLDNLEATRDRLRTFLDDAQDVDEALAVNRELSQIEAEIEQVQGRMNYLSGRAAYSTIAINLSMPYDIPTPTPTPWALGRTFNSAVKAQGALLRFLADAATWLVIVFGPYLVVLVIIILIVRALMRRRKKSGSS